MSFIQLPFGLPRVTKDGEIVNSYARVGDAIGFGRHGTAHDGVLNGERACFKRYHVSWSNAFTSNPAKYEYGRLLKARSDLSSIADSLQAPIGWYKDPIVGLLLVSHLVRNYDSSPSQSLKQTPEISQSFLQRLEGIFEQLTIRQVLFNPTDANILVQKISASESRPVLIDFTNYENYLHYPAKGLAYLLSADNKARHISQWLEVTLAVARGKVAAGNATSLNELRLPPPDSRQA